MRIIRIIYHYPLDIREVFIANRLRGGKQNLCVKKFLEISQITEIILTRPEKCYITIMLKIVEAVLLEVER